MLVKLKTTLFFSNNGSMSPLAGSIRVWGGDMCAGQSVVFPSIPMLPVTDSERADTPAEASGTWIQKTHVCRRQSKRAFMFSLGI